MDTSKFLNPVLNFLKSRIALFKAGKVGGKYLERKQVAGKNGKLKWVYKYKPMSQRGAHEVTGKTFQKKTGGSSDEHKSAVEKALQSGNRVSLHILKDYPDLAEKFGMGKRLERSKKISSKVSEIKNSVKSEPKKTETVNKDSEVKSMDHVNEYKSVIEGKMKESKSMINDFKSQISNYEKQGAYIYPEEIKDLKSAIKRQNSYLKAYNETLSNPEQLEYEANIYRNRKQIESQKNQEPAKKPEPAKKEPVKEAKKKPIPENIYDDLIDFDQNVEYGDTQSENKYINKLVKLSEKYDITDYVNESAENGLLADEDVMKRFQQKLSKK